VSIAVGVTRQGLDVAGAWLVVVALAVLILHGASLRFGSRRLNAAASVLGIAPDDTRAGALAWHARIIG
jgi:hypothetical protein